MRIAISGAACQGKTTFINDFIKEWPKYTTPTESYRDVVKSKEHKINKEVTKESQWSILNFMIDQLQKHGDKGNKIIFDRCPFDNLVYSLWGNVKNSAEFDDAFISKCIPLVCESMKYLDIIFFTPITKIAPVKIEDKEQRETDQEFITEIDTIFKSIIQQFQKTGASVFFPKDDSPGIVEIFGKPEERIQLARYYLNADGDLIGEEASIFNTLDEKEIQKLLAEQKELLHREKKDTAFKKNLIIGGE
jgi:predicted ATPase